MIGICMLKTSEKYIQSNLIKFLNSQKKVWHIKTIVSNRVGCPDILCCIDGKFVAIELKSKAKTASKIQMLNIEKIIKAGGVAYIFDNLDLAIETLKKDFECII